MSRAPTVIYPLTLPGLLDYALTTQSNSNATTLIICCSRDAFIQHLSRSLQHGQAEEEPSNLQKMFVPTLNNLLTTRHMKVAFCASVQALLAYLTAYGRSGAERVETPGDERQQRLFLVNVLALHAPTPAFSAQGLSRTFATATETALRIQAELLLVECETEPEAVVIHDNDDETVSVNNADLDEHVETESSSDPWDQEVSILNVSARKFGSGVSDRPWAGRVVKAKRIAARWFYFHKLEKEADNEIQSEENPREETHQGTD